MAKIITVVQSVRFVPIIHSQVSTLVILLFQVHSDRTRMVLAMDNIINEKKISTLTRIDNSTYSGVPNMILYLGT